MNDQDVERLLRRYEPADPPIGLRARVLNGADRMRRTWPWLAASAALLALTTGAHVASDRLQRELHTLTPPDTRSAQIDELEQALGGGEDARRFAERILLERELDRALEQASLSVGTSGAIQ